jgi:uncharacterized ion transporter superfamily protein YfcC
MSRKYISINTYFLVFLFIVLMAILTWIIPGGEYQFQEMDGRKIVVPNSFKKVERNPQGLFSILIAPIKGFSDPNVTLIIGFVLIIGGVFSVLQRTGTIDSLIRVMASHVKKKPFLDKFFIPIFMIIFSIGGATFGMSEEVIPFVILFIPLALYLGYDTVVGVSIPFIGAGAGFASAFMNPFTVGIAQQISGLPLFSGFTYRVICWLIVTAVAIAFVMRYAHKIRKDSSKSITFFLDEEKRKSLNLNELDVNEKLLLKHKLVGIVFLLGISFMIFGVLKYRWYIDKITAIFLAIGIIGAIVGRLKIDEFTTSFISGAKDLVGTAFIIVMARGILYIAQDGKIIDTILHSATNLIKGFHPYVTAVMMFITQTIINFFVPSGSAKAALTMPLMAPLADLTGLSRQVAVLAYQFGDGFTNMVVPTSAVTMTVLSSAQIPYEKWVGTVWKLQIWFSITGLILLLPPVLTGW